MVATFETIGDYISRLGFDPGGNPDFYIYRYEEVANFSGFHTDSFRNSFFEISLDLSDGCAYAVDSFHCESGKNRVSVISPFRLQTIYASDAQSTGEEEPKGYSLFFRPEFVGLNPENSKLLEWLPFIGHTAQPVLQLKKNTVAEFIAVYERILYHHKNPGSETENIIRHYISILLLLVKNNYVVATHNVAFNRENQIYTAFRQLLEHHFLEFTSVKEFADRLHLSPKHASETIKQVSGKSILRQLNEKKADHAKSLLLQTSLSIKEIAYRSGFEDEAYFYTFFKRLTGQTPASFRRK